MEDQTAQDQTAQDQTAQDQTAQDKISITIEPAINTADESTKWHINGRTDKNSDLIKKIIEPIVAAHAEERKAYYTYQIEKLKISQPWYLKHSCIIVAIVAIVVGAIILCNILVK